MLEVNNAKLNDIISNTGFDNIFIRYYKHHYNLAIPHISGLHYFLYESLMYNNEILRIIQDLDIYVLDNFLLLDNLEFEETLIGALGIKKVLIKPILSDEKSTIGMLLMSSSSEDTLGDLGEINEYLDTILSTNRSYRENDNTVSEEHIRFGGIVHEGVNEPPKELYIAENSGKRILINGLPFKEIGRAKSDRKLIVSPIWESRINNEIENSAVTIENDTLGIGSDTLYKEISIHHTKDGVAINVTEEVNNVDMQINKLLLISRTKVSKCIDKLGKLMVEGVEMEVLFKAVEVELGFRMGCAFINNNSPREVYNNINEDNEVNAVCVEDYVKGVIESSSLIYTEGAVNIISIPLFDINGKLFCVVGITRKDNQPIGKLEMLRMISNAEGLKSVLLEIKKLDDIKINGYIDTLTGLYNRRFIEEKANNCYGSEYIAEKAVGLVVCDIDGLKKVNDSLGHEFGDMLIKDVSDVLLSSFRKSDIVARIGGDEFVILIEKTDNEKMEMLINRLKNVLDTKNSERKKYAVSASIGYVISDGNKGFDELFTLADGKMYQDKRGKSDIMQIITSKKGEILNDRDRLYVLERLVIKLIKEENKDTVFNCLELCGNSETAGLISMGNGEISVYRAESKLK